MARERKHPPRRKRRGRFRFFYKLISLVAVVAAVVTACVIFFRVNQIGVEGNSHYSAQEIIAASEIEMGDNLVTLWTGQINRLVCDKLPYVQRVMLRRTLPDQVTLRVVERTVAATVDGPNSRWLMASDGYLLEPTGQSQGIEIVGLEVVEPQAGHPMEVSETDTSKGEAIIPLMEALEEAGMLEKCTKFDCSAASSILVSYDIHQLRFPLHGDYGQMLSLFQAALDSGRLPQGEARVFDFTIADNKVFAQNPKNSSQPVASAQPSAQPSQDPAATASVQPSQDPAGAASAQPSATPAP